MWQHSVKGLTALRSLGFHSKDKNIAIVFVCQLTVSVYSLLYQPNFKIFYIFGNDYKFVRVEYNDSFQLCPDKTNTNRHNAGSNYILKISRLILYNTKHNFRSDYYLIVYSPRMCKGISIDGTMPSRPHVIGKGSDSTLNPSQ